MARYIPPNAYPRYVEAFEAHDQSCLSLDNFWFARVGGVSDMWSQGPCDGCDDWFYVEGLVNIFWDDEDKDEVMLCACCAVRRGYTVVPTSGTGFSYTIVD